MEEVASSGAEAKTGGLAPEEKEISISAFFAALGVLVARTKASAPVLRVLAKISQGPAKGWVEPAKTARMR